jgi:hypothetical protein
MYHCLPGRNVTLLGIHFTMERRNLRFPQREIWPATKEILCLTEGCCVGFLCVRTHFRSSTAEEGFVWQVRVSETM